MLLLFTLVLFTASLYCYTFCSGCLLTTVVCLSVFHIISNSLYTCSARECSFTDADAIASLMLLTDANLSKTSSICKYEHTAYPASWHEVKYKTDVKGPDVRKVIKLGHVAWHKT